MSTLTDEDALACSTVDEWRAWLAANGRMSDAAMDRAVVALKVCGGKLRNRSFE